MGFNHILEAFLVGPLVLLAAPFYLIYLLFLVIFS